MTSACTATRCKALWGLLLGALLLPCSAQALQKEFSLGAGTSLNSLQSTQLMVVVAVQKPFREFLLRAEASLEAVQAPGDTLGVLGGALLLRLPLGAKGPFLELGGGLNLASSDALGDRDLGGPFFLSFIASTGYGRGPWALAVRYRHLSNAWLYEENPGLDSLYLMLFKVFK